MTTTKTAPLGKVNQKAQDLFDAARILADARLKMAGKIPTAAESKLCDAFAEIWSAAGSALANDED